MDAASCTLSWIGELRRCLLLLMKKIFVMDEVLAIWPFPGAPFAGTGKSVHVPRHG